MAEPPQHAGLVGNAVGCAGSVCALFGQAGGTTNSPVVIKGVQIADDCSFCASSAAAALLAEATGPVEIGGDDAACRIAGEVYAGDVAAGVLAQSDVQGGAGIKLTKCTVVGRIYGRRCGGMVGVVSQGPAELRLCVLDGVDENVASITSTFGAGGLVYSYCAADKDADTCLIYESHSLGTMSFFQNEEDRETTDSSCGGFIGCLSASFTLGPQESKPAIFRISGQCVIKSKMLYSNDTYRIGGVLGYTSHHSADELSRLFWEVVAVESLTGNKDRLIGTYCGVPWLDVLQGF